jgi:argininosuccinate lyase
VTLTEQGVVSRADAGAILAALEEVEQAGHGALSGGEDVHEAIETAVVERVGPDGGRMHTARSRNDEVAACVRYRLREDLLALLETLLEARERLLGVAGEHTETVMPGYTHLQPAQPTTVAHWVCSYEAALARDTGRVLDAYDRVNRSPLGAAAFAGTPFDVDRERTAELLGFETLVENAMDAAAARDFLVETTAATVALATTLSGLAEDAVTFASRGHLELDDDYASTSSIMPQKKNPDTLELARAVAGDAVGALTGVATTLKGLPRAYNRDLQRADPHVWDAVDAVRGATGACAGAVSTASWDEAALADDAGDGFSTATGVADALALAGVPFRTAHEVVARAGTADAEALDEAARAVLGESLFARVDRAVVERALDPAESVRARDSHGGPAPEAVRGALDRADTALAADREAVADRRDRGDRAAAELAEVVDGYV